MRKYIREREDKIIFARQREKEQPRIEFLERKQERNRERDENSERLWPLVLRLIRQGQKKIVFRVFIFFLKASLLNSFFDEKHKKTKSREKTPQYKK